MKFLFGFKGFRWLHVDVSVAEFLAGFLEFRGAELLID